MTTPARDHDAEGPDAQLHALYLEGRGEDVPAPEIDRLILRAAHASCSPAARVAKAPWWRTWRPVASVLVAAGLGLAVTMNVLHQQQMADLQDMQSSADSAAVVERKSAELAASAPAATVAPAAKVAPAAPVAAIAEGAVSAKRAAIPSAPAANVLAPAAPAVTDESHSMSRAKATAPMAGASHSDVSVNERTAAPLEIDQELARIRELARAGQLSEAQDLIRQIKLREPALILPKDIEALMIMPAHSGAR